MDIVRGFDLGTLEGTSFCSYLKFCLSIWMVFVWVGRVGGIWHTHVCFLSTDGRMALTIEIMTQLHFIQTIYASWANNLVLHLLNLERYYLYCSWGLLKSCLRPDDHFFRGMNWELRASRYRRHSYQLSLLNHDFWFKKGPFWCHLMLPWHKIRQ